MLRTWELLVFDRYDVAVRLVFASEIVSRVTGSLAINSPPISMIACVSRENGPVRVAEFD